MKSLINKIRNHYNNHQDIYAFGIIAGVFILSIFIMTKFYLSNQILQYTSHISNQDEEQFIHDFTSGMEIEQKFVCYSDFDFITLSFSDHDQVIQGKVGIQISDATTNEILMSEEREASSIHYSKPVEISFDSFGGGKADILYEITLSSFETEDVGLGVFGYKSEGETASIDGRSSEYVLSIGMHSYTNIYKNLTKWVLGIGIFTVVCTIIATFAFGLREEHMFLILSLPFVLCMLLMGPGNEVYDQGRHYHTVYHYSNILLGCGTEDTMSEIQMRECDIVDKNVEEKIGEARNGQAQKLAYYVDRMYESVDDTTTIEVDVSSSPVVNDGKVIQYAPGVLGMTLARLLGLNHFWMLIVTKIAIIGFYLCVCYYAIVKIPILKMMLVLVSALPMNLYQAAGISYDSFTYAVGILVFAFIIKLWHEGFEKADWIKLAIAVAVLGNCKGGVYLTLILLMCFIPREKYESRKWIKIGLMLIIAGISMLFGFMSTIISWFIIAPQGDNVSGVINSGGAVAEKLSIMYVLSEPINFVKMFLQTMIENGDIYLGQLLGYRTAWASDTIPIIVVLPFLVLLILSVIGEEKDRFGINVIGRIGIGGILLIELIGMQAIFLSETPVYSDVIIGFQGRYFILFIPCILLLFRNEGLVFKEKKEYLYPCFSIAQLVYLFFFLELFMQT